MNLIDGVYVSELFSVELQKNTIQLKNFLSNLDKDDWECLMEDCESLMRDELLKKYDDNKHLEFFIENFSNVFIAKIYKAKFYDFEQEEGDFSFKKDFSDLYLFYKFSYDFDTLISKINEETINLMQSEIEEEKNS